MVEEYTQEGGEHTSPQSIDNSILFGSNTSKLTNGIDSTTCVHPIDLYTRRPLAIVDSGSSENFKHFKVQHVADMCKIWPASFSTCLLMQRNLLKEKSNDHRVNKLSYQLDSTIGSVTFVVSAHILCTSAATQVCEYMHIFVVFYTG